MTIPASECTSLQMVRDEIDRIDKVLVAAIAERGAYVLQAAKFKADAGAVRAPDRVAQVIDKVTRLAKDLGADPVVVEATWRAMINAFIDRELVEHAALGSRN